MSSLSQRRRYIYPELCLQGCAVLVHGGRKRGNFSIGASVPREPSFFIRNQTTRPVFRAPPGRDPFRCFFAQHFASGGPAQARPGRPTTQSDHGENSHPASTPSHKMTDGGKQDVTSGRFLHEALGNSPGTNTGRTSGVNTCV